MDTWIPIVTILYFLYVRISPNRTAVDKTEDSEDMDDMEGKSQKPLAELGLRLYEGPHDIPVSIDSLFSQISPASSDDQGQYGSAECVQGSELSELDMCITQSQAQMFESLGNFPHVYRKRRRQASANGFSLWKNGVIPYIFNSTFPAHDREAILGAMLEWEKATCIRFRLARADDVDVVVFRDGRRCSTNIGRIGREQMVTLAKSCRSKRILIHELGHVIGLIHEHQRHDRDKYVKVILENVRNMSQERYQFSKLLSGSITDKTVKYDYTSVMHYGRNYFAKSPELTTLQTTDSRYHDIIGRAERPSFSDVETVNRLYQCSAGCNQYLHCSDNCYLDSSCTCRCSTITAEKPVLAGPGPYRNSLHDSTCDFFAIRGECTGNIKETVRPLCAKSCGILLMKLAQSQPPAWQRHTASANGPPQAKQGDTAVGSAGDINTVGDLQMLATGDAMAPLVVSQNGWDMQQQFLWNQQAYSQNHQMQHVANVPAKTEEANARQAVSHFRAALMQKQASPSLEGSQLLRSLIMSRTVPTPGTISGQMNGYPQYGATTKQPGKHASNGGALPMGQQVGGSSASNWLSHPSMQHQYLQRQQLLQQQIMQQQQQHQQANSNNQGQNVYSGIQNNFPRETILFNNRLTRVNSLQNQAYNARPNLNYNNFQETSFGHTIQKSAYDSNLMQGGGIYRSVSSHQLSDFTGVNVGSAPDPNGMSNPSGGIDSSQNLQAIGPSFMKSGNLPPDQTPGEPLSPLGSPVEQVNTDAPPGRPMLEQQQTSVYFSGSPLQSFEPSFSLTDPVTGQQRSPLTSVWESIVQRINRHSTLSGGPAIDSPSQSGSSIDQIQVSHTVVSQNLDSPNINVDGAVNQPNQQQWQRRQFHSPQAPQQPNPTYHLLNRELALTDPNPDVHATSPWNNNTIWAPIERFLLPQRTYFDLSNGPKNIDTKITPNTQISQTTFPQDILSTQSNIRPLVGDLQSFNNNLSSNDGPFLPLPTFINQHINRYSDSQGYKYFHFPALIPNDEAAGRTTWPDNTFLGSSQTNAAQPLNRPQPDIIAGQSQRDLQYGGFRQFS